MIVNPVVCGCRYSIL